MRIRNNNQATATINREVDITVGSDKYLVGFSITAKIDKGEMPSRDNPGEPPSVDEWVDLKIEYAQAFPYTPTTMLLRDSSIFKQQILGLAEMHGMEWVDDYDETENDDYEN